MIKLSDMWPFYLQWFIVDIVCYLLHVLYYKCAVCLSSNSYARYSYTVIFINFFYISIKIIKVHQSWIYASYKLNICSICYLGIISSGNILNVLLITIPVILYKYVLNYFLLLLFFRIIYLLPFCFWFA